MKFKLARLKISKELNVFSSQMIKKHKVDVLRATKNNLTEIAAISQEIQENGLPKHLVLKKLKGGIGHGIFLHPEAKPILKGEMIAPYSGEVFLSPQNQEDDSDYMFSLIADLLLTKKEQTHFDPENRYHPRRLYSLDLDARKQGNFTRFINHSEKPNIEAKLLRFPSDSLGATFEIVYFAKKNIRPGEQLLVCYDGDDDSYWGALNIKPFLMTPKTFQLNSSLKIV